MCDALLVTGLLSPRRIPPAKYCVGLRPNDPTPRQAVSCEGPAECGRFRVIQSIRCFYSNDAMGLYRWVRDAIHRAIDRGRRDGLGAGRGYRTSLEHAINCGVRPEVVYDVGAATGTPWLYEAFPRAFHVLFEPLPSHVEVLKKSYARPNFEIHEVALGR